MIRNAQFVVSGLLLLMTVVYAQSTAHIPFLEQARITHAGGTVTIEAREPRPLRQAVQGVRAEYGWLVDYEDPIYDRTKDVVDDTDIKWTANHPLARGVTRPAGEHFLFSTQEPSASELDGGQAGPQLLTRMLGAYGETTNPGKFRFANEGNRRFAVVGDIESQGFLGVFDCKIVLTNGTHSIDEVLNTIFQSASQKVGKQVRLGFAPMNLLLKQTRVDSGGKDAIARTAFARALDDTKVNLVYEALFDADADFYMVNIYPAVKNTYDVSGRRTSVLLRQR